MQTVKAQQLDVTESRETVAGLVRRLQQSGQPVELTERGRVVARVTPEKTAGEEAIQDVPLAEQKAAWRQLRKIQEKVGRMMKRTGKTEDELMKIILEDD